jgi:hypothetical protein
MIPRALLLDYSRALERIHEGTIHNDTIAAWEIWKERNARCFRSATTLSAQLLATIKHTADQWVVAGARNLGRLMRE